MFFEGKPPRLDDRLLLDAPPLSSPSLCYCVGFSHPCVLSPGRPKLCCETCRIAHNLWICMVCGHIGCGRYTGEHASRHFRISSHNYR